MTKQKRKFYGIKRMRRAGLDYAQREEKIQELRRLAVAKPVESYSSPSETVKVESKSTIMSNSFSFKQMLLKGLKYVILFGIPILVDQFIVQFPQIAQLTVGGLLVVLVNVMKVKWGVRII